MRPRLLVLAVAGAVLAATVSATSAAPPTVSRTRARQLMHQVWAAGTWDQQEAAFTRLPLAERQAVWALMTDVRPGRVTITYPNGPYADLRGRCPEGSSDACDLGPGPHPQPTASPAPHPAPKPDPTDPEDPVGIAPGTKICAQPIMSIPYEVAGDPQDVAFVYWAQTFYCYRYGSTVGPLTDYSSNSWPTCCKFPWKTDRAKYKDLLTPLPASNTQHITDHHTGYFETYAEAAGVKTGFTNTPNLHATVIASGDYVGG